MIQVVLEHHQQRTRREHFRHLRARHRAEQLAQQVAPAQHDQRDRADRAQHRLP
jgi:hypothetical protein